MKCPSSFCRYACHVTFSYPEPFLRAVNGARRGALAKSKPDIIKAWYPVKHCACSSLIEHAQCLTGYHVFKVSGLDFARAPRRATLTARKKGSVYENGHVTTILVPRASREALGTRMRHNMGDAIFFI